MKRFIRKPLSSIIFLSLMIFPNMSFAQNMILGNWKVCCAVKYDSSNKIVFSELCPVLSDEKAADFKDFQMKIDPDKIQFNFDGVIKEVTYKWDEDRVILEFTYQEKTHKFNVHLLLKENCNTMILEDQEGHLLYLEK